MSNYPYRIRLSLRQPLIHFLGFGVLLLVLNACSNSASTITSSNGNGSFTQDIRQVLTFPNVGTQDLGYLDPAMAPDINTDQVGADLNSDVVMKMLYSGLVSLDKDLRVQPDQATWEVSPDNTIYTFHLKNGLAFSDGTPVTAQSYVYTLTRALLPELKSETAPIYEGNIVGALDVLNGKTRTLAGVKAIDSITLQITLVQPRPYFLSMLANPIFFPLNQKLIDQYGQTDWVDHIATNGAGTGPFMLQEWDHNVKMILVPNPNYYGTPPKLTEVDMLFIADATTAFKEYRAGQYDLVWNLDPTDLLAARGTAGYTEASLLQTDMLFFNNSTPPFDNTNVRQAFAYATDKTTLANTTLLGSVIPAQTIIPPGMPGYQQDYQGLHFDKKQAQDLLKSVYPDLTKMPPITFSYPTAQVPQSEALALQKMWFTALGVQVTLNPVESNAYNNELSRHEIQFGFFQWTANYPDPYNWLTGNLLPGVSTNYGNWNNIAFVQMVTLAEQSPGDLRLTLYNQAEQIVITDAGWLPLDHTSLAAIIPSWVHGISLNKQGLYFGDWSEVYLSHH